ncbi:uncharacterized protein METZ01_LOCUS418870, partial [marine metagenome]
DSEGFDNAVLLPDSTTALSAPLTGDDTAGGA